MIEAFSDDFFKTSESFSSEQNIVPELAFQSKHISTIANRSFACHPSALGSISSLAFRCCLSVYPIGTRYFVYNGTV
jgi:hypothetical protein